MGRKSGIKKLLVEVSGVGAGGIAAIAAWSGHAGLATVAGAGSLLMLITAALVCLRQRQVGADCVASADARQQPPDAPAADASISAHDSRGDLAALVHQMLMQKRYALLLRPEIAPSLAPQQYAQVRAELERHTSLVPAGEVVLRAWGFEAVDTTEDPHGSQRTHAINAIYLDRYPVTNREFYDFVAAGGYQQMGLWDQDAWPGVMELVDRTGDPGPRFWENGHYPVHEEEHPVVGICWYEAAAYARWVGKRLPTDAEWVKASSWPLPQPGALPVQRRYPWGATMQRRLANLWGSGPGRTVSIHEYPDGVSVGGIYQLIGNVWEWTASDFGEQSPCGQWFDLPAPLKSIRGGAFDTYFDNHATCQFHSGESLFARKPNIGLRLALDACAVASANEDDGDERAAGDDHESWDELDAPLAGMPNEQQGEEILADETTSSRVPAAPGATAAGWGTADAAFAPNA